MKISTRENLFFKESRRESRVVMFSIVVLVLLSLVSVAQGKTSKQSPRLSPGASGGGLDPHPNLSYAFNLKKNLLFC